MRLLCCFLCVLLCVDKLFGSQRCILDVKKVWEHFMYFNLIMLSLSKSEKWKLEIRTN